MGAHGNWTLIFSAGTLQEAELVKGRLEENGVMAMLMDNGGRVYPQLNDVGVYVEREQVVRALHLLGKQDEA